VDKDLNKKLTSLAQLDRDAMSVYDEALDHTTDDDVKVRFREFRGEHEYHVGQITEAIKRLGGEAPELTVDMMGHVADWVTSIRSIRGTEGALHAMRTAEKFHNSHYADAAGWKVDDEELGSMLRRFYADEQKHLAFIETRLGVHAGSKS
jgi:rubrerythrin